MNNLQHISPYTHRLAVTAYILRQERFLLLKRNTPPRIWGLPGGRLERDENPKDGILREISEETGLTVDLIAPVDIWYGDFGRGIFVSIDYLAIDAKGEIRLCPEHSDYCWVTIEDLRNDHPPLEKKKPFFNLTDFEKAWELYQKLTK